jgi:D-3-phosphoglycerate dehydrogenase / 2-oxoglutarate reductase
VALQIAEQMADFLLAGAVSNAVNMPSLTAEEAARLKPYMALAGQLGGLAGQLTDTGIRAVAIEYEGGLADLNTRPLTATILAALLAPQLASVNLVNAPLICRERDIRVSETRHADAGDYQNLIRVTVTVERRKRTRPPGQNGRDRREAAPREPSQRGVAGTVFAGNKPRLVDVEGIPLEAELGRHMLFVRNLDKPGFIGALGQTLGAAEINIATFHLGRAAPGEDAIALVEVDQKLTPKLIEEVRALPNVIQALAIHF